MGKQVVPQVEKKIYQHEKSGYIQWIKSEF